MACEPQPLSHREVQNTGSLDGNCQVGPVKYRGFNQATVTGRTWGGGLQGFRRSCCVFKCPCRPPSESSRQPRCAATNRQPGGFLGSRRLLDFDCRRLPLDCCHSNRPGLVNHSADTVRCPHSATPVAEMGNVSSVPDEGAPLYLRDQNRCKSSPPWTGAVDRCPSTGSPPCDSAEVLHPPCAMDALRGAQCAAGGSTWNARCGRPPTC